MLSNYTGIRMSEGPHDGGNCYLCHKANARMRRLSQLEIHPQFKEVYMWLMQHRSDLENEACLCLPCIKQIQRNHHKKFTPRWLPKPAVPPKLCNVQHCQGVVHAKTSLLSAAALETCLKAKVSDHSTLIGLCQEHYTKMYSTLNTIPCVKIISSTLWA